MSNVDQVYCYLLHGGTPIILKSHKTDAQHTTQTQDGKPVVIYKRGREFEFRSTVK